MIVGPLSSRSSSTTAPASRRPTPAIRPLTVSPWRSASSAFSSTSIHFGFPTSRASSSIASQILMISPCASSNASSSVCFGHLVAARLDHRQRVARPDDDEVEGRLLHLLEGRVDDHLAVDQPDADRPDRAEERQRRDRERGRSAVDREDVVRDDHVGRQHGADHLHLVLEALRPERPDRPVDHARRERRALGRAPLALEEAARDLPRRVHPLLDVDRQREEIRVRPRIRPADRRRENHRVPAPDDDCAVRLLRQLARLEAQVTRAHVDGNRGLTPGLDRAHSVSSIRPLPMWRKVEV